MASGWFPDLSRLSRRRINPIEINKFRFIFNMAHQETHVGFHPRHAHLDQTLHDQKPFFRVSNQDFSESFAGPGSKRPPHRWPAPSAATRIRPEGDM